MSANRAIWRDATKLSHYLGLENASELYDYIASDLFKPFFEELLEDGIVPAQEAAKERGAKRRRGNDLKSIQQALIGGEKYGKVNYSAYRPKKANWTIGDHYARFPWLTRHENSTSNEGIFYGKALSEDEMNLRVCMLLSRVQFEMTPSRAKASKAGAIFEAP